MFNEETQSAFEEYENLKLGIKKAEERMKELQSTVMEAIPEGKEIEGKEGVFYIQNRSKWTYTDKVKQLTNNLKETKKNEEATGDATKSLIPTLYFRVNTDTSGGDEIPG